MPKGLGGAPSLGNTLRAIKVYVITAFEVAVLGEYREEAEQAGVRRRR